MFGKNIMSMSKKIIATVIAIMFMTFASVGSIYQANASTSIVPSGAYPLIAGQSMLAGYMTVSSDSSNLIVEYNTFSDWNLLDTALDVSFAAPIDRGSPGLYNSNSYIVSASVTNSYTKYIVPINWNSLNAGATLYIKAHASVVGIGSNTTAHQTAYGKEIDPQNNPWFFYITYKKPVPTPTPTPTVEPTPTPTVEPTPTPTVVPTPTPTVEPTPTPTVVPTPTPTVEPTPTPTVVPTPTVDPTPTVVPTPTPTPTVVDIPTDTVPAGPAVTEQPQPTATPAAEASVELPQDAIPGAPVELPKTGGVPDFVFYSMGAGVIAMGILVRKIFK